MTIIFESERISSATLKRFSVKDFWGITEIGILPEESGWEIIDGRVVDKVKIGSRNAAVVRKLAKVFFQNFGDSILVSIRNPIHIDDYNECEPDIALLIPRGDFYAESHPTPKEVLLLIEVSDLTIEYDRDIKKTIYAEAEIAEFWLVNLKEDTVERYSSTKNGNFRLAEILESGETIKAGTIENLELKIEEILGS